MAKTRRTAKSHLRKAMGMRYADAVLNKADKSLKGRGSAKSIEKWLILELDAHIQAKVIPSLQKAVRTGVREAVAAAAVRSPAVRTNVPTAVRPAKRG